MIHLAQKENKRLFTTNTNWYIQ